MIQTGVLRRERAQRDWHIGVVTGHHRKPIVVEAEVASIINLHFFGLTFCFKPQAHIYTPNFTGDPKVVP
jgi:hypothetical protein